MRLLVSCDHCHRQFDASNKSIGETFHCHCGEAIRVAKPRMLDAAVIRCSNCGGPREKNSIACGFCSADFTLVEKDLNSMCPRCYARISDRAKFCHHCGGRVLVESVAGEETDLSCPLQHQPAVNLTSRQLGELKLGALECPQCAGLFLGNETFDQLCDQAVRRQIPKFGQATNTSPRAQAGPMYRKCPYCQQMMTRRNYGKRSGVIIDCCSQHGIWFDDDELRRILQFLTDGGMRRHLPSVREQPQSSSSETPERPPIVASQVRQSPMFDSRTSSADSEGLIVDSIANAILRLFS